MKNASLECLRCSKLMSERNSGSSKLSKAKDMIGAPCISGCGFASPDASGVGVGLYYKRIVHVFLCALVCTIGALLAISQKDEQHVTRKT